MEKKIFQFSRLPLQVFRYNHQVHPAKLNQFPGRIVQMLDQQKVVHAQVIHDIHLVQAYTMDDLDDVCIVLNEIHEMLNQLKNHVKIIVLQLGAV